MQEKNELEFQVLSDPRGIVSAKYNVLFDVSDYLKGAFEKIGLNLESFNGKSNWILPVPATFMKQVKFALSTSILTSCLVWILMTFYVL